MGVTPSGTDVSEIKERGLMSYNAAIIRNKKGEMFGHIADSEKELYVQNVPIEIEYGDPEEMKAIFESFIAESIKEIVDSGEYSYSKIKEITDISYKDFCIEYLSKDSLSDEEKKELDEVINKKFKSISYQYGGSFFGKQKRKFDHTLQRFVYEDDEDDDLFKHWWTLI